MTKDFHQQAFLRSFNLTFKVKYNAQIWDCIKYVITVHPWFLQVVNCRYENFMENTNERQS